MKKNRRLGAIIFASILALICGAGALYYSYSDSRYGDLAALERALPAESRRPHVSEETLGDLGSHLFRLTPNPNIHYIRKVYVLNMDFGKAVTLLEKRLRGTNWIETESIAWHGIVSTTFDRRQRSGSSEGGYFTIRPGLPGFEPAINDENQKYTTIDLFYGPLNNNPLDNLRMALSKKSRLDKSGSP